MCFRGLDDGDSGASDADAGSDGEGAVHANVAASAKRQQQKVGGPHCLCLLHIPADGITKNDNEVTTPTHAAFTCCRDTTNGRRT